MADKQGLEDDRLFPRGQDTLWLFDPKQKR